MFALPCTAQYIEQYENHRQIAKHECDFERQDGFVNRGHDAEEKLRARWIGTWQVRMVQRAGFGCLQTGESRIAGNDQIGVVAEPLHTAIPKIAMNIVVCAGWQAEKLDMPDGSENKPKNDDSSGKSGRSKKFADREQVNEARNPQRGEEVRSPRSAKLREQMVSAPHNPVPRAQTLHAGFMVCRCACVSVWLPPPRL